MEVSSQDIYPVTFTETGLAQGTPWTVDVITDHSAVLNYTSNESVMRFNETNGSYNYVPISTSSYMSSDATGCLNVSGLPVNKTANFERAAASEIYQRFVSINVSQERDL